VFKYGVILEVRVKMEQIRIKEDFVHYVQSLSPNWVNTVFLHYIFKMKLLFLFS